MATSTPMIDVKQEAYLPITFRIAGFIVLAFGLKILFEHLSFLFNGTLFNLLANDFLFLLKLLAGPSLTILGLIMLTAHYRLQIDPSQKTYCIYVWLLGLKSGKDLKFNYISKIYINQVTEKGMFTSRGGIQHDIRDKMYKAFLKLDNGEKIHLDTSKTEDQLNSKIEVYISKLNGLYRPNLDVE